MKAGTSISVAFGGGEERRIGAHGAVPHRIGAGLDVHAGWPPRVRGVELRAEAEPLLEPVEVDAAVDDRDRDAVAVEAAGAERREVEPRGDLIAGADRIVVEAGQVRADHRVGEDRIAIQGLGHPSDVVDLDLAPHRKMAQQALAEIELGQADPARHRTSGREHVERIVEREALDPAMKPIAKRGAHVAPEPLRERGPEQVVACLHGEEDGDFMNRPYRRAVPMQLRVRRRPGFTSRHASPAISRATRIAPHALHP
jgi:hypothetical protein